MAEYIEREAVLDRIDGIWDCADMVFEPEDHCCGEDDCAHCKWRKTKNAIRKIIANIPAADVAPVKHGRWKRVDPRSTVVTFRCSECNHYANMDATNFCPQCGAQMDADMWEVDDDCRRT